MPKGHPLLYYTDSPEGKGRQRGDKSAGATGANFRVFSQGVAKIPTRGANNRIELWNRELKGF